MMLPPSRAPKDCACPICRPLNGDYGEGTLIRPTDIVWRGDHVTVLINSFFMGKNAGSAIVTTNQHVESLYELPLVVGHNVIDAARQTALAMKAAYHCDGIKLIQNNEPAADQHAFHFHLHVYPRYDNDGFNTVLPADKRLAPPTERAEYAAKLKAAFQAP